MSKSSKFKIKKCKIKIRKGQITRVRDYILNSKEKFHEVQRKEENLIGVKCMNGNKIHWKVFQKQQDNTYYCK